MSSQHESYLKAKQQQLVPPVHTNAIQVTEEPLIKSGKVADEKPPRPEDVMTPPSKEMINVDSVVLSTREIEQQDPMKSEAAEAAIAKLMDQGKFTDTLDQLNKAVSQKEKLEAKLNRIKEKIKSAKNIRLQP